MSSLSASGSYQNLSGSVRSLRTVGFCCASALVAVQTSKTRKHFYFHPKTSKSSPLSLIGQQSTGSEAQAAARRETAEENSATLCEEVTKLSAAVQASQDLLQVHDQD